jgi:hypothetical protein
VRSALGRRSPRPRGRSLPGGSRSTQVKRPTFVPIGRVTPKTSTGIAYTRVARPTTIPRARRTCAHLDPISRSSGTSLASTDSSIPATLASVPGAAVAEARSRMRVSLQLASPRRHPPTRGRPAWCPA